MPGVLLMLAGLVTGDGRPGVIPAREPVTPRLEGRWVGTLRSWGTDYQAELDEGRLRCTFEGARVGRNPTPLALAFMAGGRVRVRWEEENLLGIWKVERGRILVCISGRKGRWPTSFKGDQGLVLLTLHPAAPRKP